MSQSITKEEVLKAQEVWGNGELQLVKRSLTKVTLQQ